MTTTITARVDADKKRQAEEIFDDLGLTLSGAINVFINEVVMYQGIPFNLRRRVVSPSRIEAIMDETDEYCRTHNERLSHSQVFGHAREVVDAGRRKRNNNDKTERNCRNEYAPCGGKRGVAE